MPQELLKGPLFLVVVGAVVLAAFMVKSLLGRLRLPPLVGYFAIGIVLRLTHNSTGFMNEESLGALEFLANLGIVALLFHVGLESNLRSLLGELPRAVGVWSSDVLVSFSAAFAFTKWGLGFDLIPALFCGTALSATSVGISLMVWEDLGALKTRLGALLLDVAELDDLSAVLLLLITLAVAPVLQDGGALSTAWKPLMHAAGGVMGKAVAFGLGCLLFSRYLEKPTTEFFARLERGPDPMLSIAAVALIAAGVAGWLGFSVAVGALFAGLIFSRDPQAVRMEGSFEPIHAMFTPFFFINIGFGLELSALSASLGVGALLIVPAVLGKMVGAGGPIVGRGMRQALIMGVSMIPRAEIALLVAHTGQRLGPWAMPDDLYGALVFVCAVGSVAPPLVLGPMLRAWGDQLPAGDAGSDAG
ncbi:cation:proton antiporter [bacterium]|nr:cation:proton antiporter [bacterium]MCB9476899.1 cation:proton antiporter [Deltaproteobacteria bacterium]MCB9480030.1 cation:proton antiporter [Deltaproteobacteria bacterium]